MNARNLFLFLLIITASSVVPGAQISGQVTDESGRGLANITVILTVSEGTDTQHTDAFGRYLFDSLNSDEYQIRFEDQNFIYYLDEDPYPDEGTIYINYARPDSIALQQGQTLNIGTVVLQRVDSSDNRQTLLRVTDCENFGDNQSTQTLAYALDNAREIVIECSGTLTVPELIIGKDVKITAPAGAAFEGRGNNRILRVLPGVTLEISGVDLTGGRFNNGSGIYNSGITTINDAEITRNNGDTAAVTNIGTLNLRQVRQYQNIITYDSVFRNTGIITGHDVTIESHTSSAGPVITNEGSIELKQCSISGLGTNNVFAINNKAGSQFKLFNCTLTNSSSLFQNEGTLEIYDSSLDSNQGDQSLIESSGVLKIGGTGITNNDVHGLVVYNNGQAEILNSTISTNRAGFSFFGSASNSEDYRGVISNEGLMQVSSSTVAANTHPGFTDRQIGNAGELRLTNTIIHGTGNGEECGGATAIVSQGHNLHTDGSCGMAVQSDIPFGNPGLLTLADNGGLGKTHELQEESDAINAGNCNNGATSKDQRGVARPQGNGCDIGAFELEITEADNTDNSDDDTDSDSTTSSDTNLDPGDTSGGGTDNGPTGGGIVSVSLIALAFFLTLFARRRLKQKKKHTHPKLVSVS